MAALFPKIYDLIDANPSKTTTLRWREPTATEGFSSERWDAFWVTPMDPPGALSIFLLETNPLYELASPSLRKQLLTETLLALHQRVDTELVGRRYPRKKIQDLLANQISASSPSPSRLVEEVLCELFSLQKILLNRRTKTVSFVPADPRCWRTDRRVLVSEEDTCWRFVAAETIPLSSWLKGKEQEGWGVEWPTADGKFEELKQSLTQRGFATDGKQKKEEVAKRLGKLQSLDLLEEVTLSPFQ